MSETHDGETKFMQYDVIYIGQLGAIVCNIMQSLKNNNFKYLIINNSKCIIEPALLPVQNPKIQIKRSYLQLCDFQGQKIFKIYPQTNLLAMENKKIYRYRYLVYTAAPQQWVDYSMIQNLHQALSTNYSFVYSNIMKNDPQLSSADAIFQRFQSSKILEIRRNSFFENSKNRIKEDSQNNQTQKAIYSGPSINIVFYLPSPPNGGCKYFITQADDNLNILYKIDQFIENFSKKASKIKRELKKSSGNPQNTKQSQVNEYLQLHFFLLLQKRSIIPYCRKIDQYIQEKLQQKGVKILKFHKIQKVDYLRRKIYITKNQEEDSEKEQTKTVSIMIKEKTSLSFDYLYVAMKQKTPSILEQSGIDPFNNCLKTLENKIYNNIFIYGADLFPTTHSFLAINYQAHIIATNLSKILKNSIRKLDDQGMKKYNGHTKFKLWVSSQQCIQFQHHYQDDIKESKINMHKQQGRQRAGTSKIIENKCCLNVINLAKHKLLFRWEVDMFYNLKSYGAPFYFFVPQSNQQFDF